MSLRESIVFSNGIIYMLLWTFHLPVFLKVFITFCASFAAILNLLSFSQTAVEENLNWKLRSGCNSGAVTVVLLPLAVLLSVPLEIGHELDGYGIALCTFCVGLLFCSVISTAAVISQGGFEIAMPAFMGTLVTLSTSVCLANNVLCMILGCIGLLIYVKLQHCLPRLFPYSFSLGESAIVSQGVACFCFTILVRTCKKIGLISFSIDQPDWDSNVITFIEAALIGAGLVLLALYNIPILRRNSFGVIITICGFIGGYAFPYLYMVFGRNPVMWLASYISKRSMTLFYFWAAGCLTAIILVYGCKPDDALLTEENTPTKDSITQNGSHINNENSENDMKTGVSVVRKYFHYLIVCLFLPGIIYDIQMMYMAASCALVVFAMLEVLRILRVWPVGEALYSYFHSYVDDKDSGFIITTHIYLLVGCAIPIWCYYGSYAKGSPAILLSGILSVGIGDTAASVMGTRYGVVKWAGTKKTAEGTVGSIVAQLLAVWFLEDVFPSLSVVSMFIPIVLTSLLEAFTSQIDNLVLPLFMYVMLASQ